MTDGAPSMYRSRHGLNKLSQIEASNAKNNYISQFHYLIDKENLCAKFLKMDNGMSVLIKTINFIRSKGLRHRQSRDLSRNLE